MADLNANQAALIERHDGRGWIVAPSPAPQNSVLLGVTAIAWNDVWAVGRIETQNGSFPWRTLIEHWDGRSWSVVPSPNAPDGTGALNAVAGVSAHDVWAVGESGGGGTPFYQFIEHWNGSSWSVVPSPTLYDTLQGVSAVSATDVWAVGSYGFLHFDGSSWSVAPDPPHISPDAVKAFTGSNAWTVGGPGGTADLIEHWNGSRWELTATNGDQYESALYGVDGLDRNDVWAVGVHDENLPLIEHRGC